MIARELPPAERDDAYPKVVAVAPGFGDYQAKTSRVIPLFELTRVGTAWRCSGRGAGGED